jgi:hypothetical protein
MKHDELDELNVRTVMPHVNVPDETVCKFLGDRYTPS